MFTLQQLRDTFFAISHQSKMKQMLDDQIARTQELIYSCQTLDEYDKQLAIKMNQNHLYLQQKIKEFYEEFQVSLRNSEKIDMEFRKRIDSNENNILMLRNNLEEQRREIKNITESTNKLATRLETVKEILS